jgi:hypothetical protein
MWQMQLTLLRAVVMSMQTQAMVSDKYDHSSVE